MPTGFGHLSSLRNYEKWNDSLRNFDWLGDAAPGASDIDLLIERGGRFLVLESKPWTKGVTLGYGQHRSLRQLSLLPQFRVYLVADEGERLHVANVGTSPRPFIRGSTVWWPPSLFLPTDKEGLRDVVRAWWSDQAAA